MREMEAMGLLTALCDYYPDILLRLNEDERRRTIALWADELGPLGDFATVWGHIKGYLQSRSVDDSKWPPKLMEVRKYVAGKINDQGHRDRLLLADPENDDPTEEEKEKSAAMRHKVSREVLDMWEERDRHSVAVDNAETAKMATTTKLIGQRMARLEALDDRERRLNEWEAELEAREDKLDDQG